MPLAGAAMAIRAGLDRDRAKLFGCSNMAMNMLLRRMGRADLTVHGFRPTFATWCKDIGVPASFAKCRSRMSKVTRLRQPYERR